MATQTLVKTGSGRAWDVEEKIRELRELFADAPEPGKRALENVFRELTLQPSAPGPRMEGAGRAETHSNRFHYGDG